MAVWGGFGVSLEVFPLPQRVGDWGNDRRLVGKTKGNLRSPPIAAQKQFSLLPAWSG